MQINKTDCPKTESNIQNDSVRIRAESVTKTNE